MNTEEGEKMKLMTQADARQLMQEKGIVANIAAVHLITNIANGSIALYDTSTHHVVANDTLPERVAESEKLTLARKLSASLLDTPEQPKE
jgi:hypothetical protein